MAGFFDKGHCLGAAQVCETTLLCRHLHDGLSCPLRQVRLPPVRVHVAGRGDEKEPAARALLHPGVQERGEGCQDAQGIHMAQGEMHGSLVICVELRISVLMPSLI